MSRGLLIFEALRSRLDTPHSVGLLWMGDRHDAETCLTAHNILKRQTSRRPTGLECATPASEWPKTARPLVSASKHSTHPECKLLCTALGQQLSVTIRYTRPVGLLSTSDQLVVGFTGLDNTQQIQQTNIQCPQWISSPRSQQSTGHRSAT